MTYGIGVLGMGMETTTHRMYFTVWKCLGTTLIRCWSFFEGRAIVVPEFDEDDPGAEYPVYVKNKEDTIRSWRGMTVDSEDTEG